MPLLTLSSLTLWMLLSSLVTLTPLTADGATVVNVNRRYCMSCVIVPGFTTELDQFRVRQRLMHPRCHMEPVECLAHQDTCVTVTMQVAPHHYWIGSGCDQRVNYDYPAGRDGCADMPTLTRNFEPGYMDERRAVQRICLCSGNLCNAAAAAHHQFGVWKLALLGGIYYTFARIAILIYR